MFSSDIFASSESNTNSASCRNVNANTPKSEAAARYHSRSTAFDAMELQATVAPTYHHETKRCQRTSDPAGVPNTDRKFLVPKKVHGLPASKIFAPILTSYDQAITPRNAHTPKDATGKELFGTAETDYYRGPQYNSNFKPRYNSVDPKQARLTEVYGAQAVLR